MGTDKLNTPAGNLSLSPEMGGLEPELRAGTFAVTHDRPLIAGRLTTLVFEYRVGPDGFSEKSILRIALPNTGWDAPLCPEPYFWPEFQRGRFRQYTEYGRCNTSAALLTRSGSRPIRHDLHEASAGEPLGPATHGPFPLLEARALMRAPGPYPNSRIYNFRRWWITVRIEEGVLSVGDTIRVVYGDPAEEAGGARIQPFPEEQVSFLAFLDLEGQGRFQPVAGSPAWCDILSGPAERLQIVVPSVIDEGEDLTLKIAYTDRVQAPADPPPQEVRLAASDAGSGRTLGEWSEQELAKPSLLVRIPAPSEQAGVRRICLIDRESGWEGRSNPVLVQQGSLKLFWGDLHSQSMYHGWNESEKRGISCNTPEQCYRYARETSCLDFVAGTDSGIFNREDIWRIVRAAALEADRPGELVTFQSAEVGDNRWGHRNIIFRGTHPEPAMPGSLSTHAVHQLYRGRDDVICIPHHTKMWFDWDSWDAELEPVVEIHSVWGSGECPGLQNWEKRERQGGSVQAAWARGYKLGVVGGSDNHTGMPGRNLRHVERDEFHPFPAGFTGVWAAELTREAIFDAIRSRHCYATTGVRIILSVHLEDYPMGSEVSWPNQAKGRALAVRVHGTAALGRVTLLKNNREIRSWQPGAEDAELHHEDTEPAQDGDFYYVRVTQVDDHRAWSSPIWINLP